MSVFENLRFSDLFGLVSGLSNVYSVFHVFHVFHVILCNVKLF